MTAIITLTMGRVSLRLAKSSIFPNRRFVSGLKKAALILLSIVVAFILIDLLFPFRPNITFSAVIEARDGTVMRSYLTKDKQWRMKSNLGDITPELRKAIVYKEDRHFYYHFGINPIAIVRAFFNNILYHRRTSGASTITMQIARMLEPAPRTYFNKVLEMFHAMQLEAHFSKKELLQMYLNIVPYGSNIQGVKAASLIYFNKTSDQLSTAEITALSIIPNRPNSLVMGKDNDKIVIQRNKWLRRFEKDKLFSHNVISDALAEPLTAYRHRMPSIAPQFAERVKSKIQVNEAIKTTIDIKMQLKAESIVFNYVNSLKLNNINNAAVLIIDNKTHEMRTYIGSSDFKDINNYGQVDGVIAVRSPGSSLKPLLYGLCFDKGLVTPKTKIADIPISLKGYSPENYDRMFRGNVTVEYALSHSLNIPAVRLLEDEGIDNLIRALINTGFTSINKNKKKLGLSMILGGCGVKLEELTALYSSFANGGEYYPLKYLLDSPKSNKSLRIKSKKDTFKPKNFTVLSEGSNFMLTKILTELHRPDLPNAYDEAQGIPRIAWKTGTSYGRKDAWSIGFNKHYTIGVWIGNFAAAGVHELSGAATATPLLFQLFNAIDYNAASEWLEPPKGLAFRLVCEETGRVPGEYCDNQIMDYYIAGISSNEKCDHLKEMWLSADEKYIYCSSCLPPNGYKTKILPNIPIDLVSYYETSKTHYEKLPPHNPACTRLFKGHAPVITSLVNGITYLIENRQQQKLQLACSAANDVQKVYWYINDKFYASTGVHQKLFFVAEAAVLKISCADDKGRNTDIEIKVKFI